MLLTCTKKAQKVILDRVCCIYFLVQFWKDKKAIIQVLINLNSKVNIITLAYAKRPGFWTWKTDFWAQKIDGLMLKTFGMVIASFQVIDKLNKI